jgi:hypothetical protein
LFEDGYHAVWDEEGYTLDITNDEGATYQVNTLFETCTCPFWTKHLGRYACKHLLGWKRLLERQTHQQIQRLCREFVLEAAVDTLDPVEVEA